MGLETYTEYKGVVERIHDAITKNKLSHAYIIEGDSVSHKEQFAEDFAKGILCEQNPGYGCNECASCRRIKEGTYRDFYLVTGDERSVKDKEIEELQARLANKPIESGGRNIAIIQNADTMTTRAQNRLLKSLEEPQVGTVIMLLTANADNFLDTIKSRCQVLRLNTLEAAHSEDEETEKARGLAAKLVKMARQKAYFFEIKETIDLVTKDKRSTLAILDGMERELRNIMVSATSTEESTWAMEAIQKVEDARTDLKYNVREKYALGELMLKLRG